jgi:hypothetical protein
MKKETLEEAAERLAIPSPKIFIEGAKWQQEQDKNKYSKEEVLWMCLNNPYKFEENIKEWFQQNKKK